MRQNREENRRGENSVGRQDRLQTRDKEPGGVSPPGRRVEFRMLENCLQHGPCKIITISNSPQCCLEFLDFQVYSGKQILDLFQMISNVSFLLGVWVFTLLSFLISGEQLAEYLHEQIWTLIFFIILAFVLLHGRPNSNCKKLFLIIH